MNTNTDNYYPALPQAPTTNPVMVTLSLDDFLRLQQQQSSLGQPLAPVQQQQQLQQQPLFVFHQHLPPTLLPLGSAASHPSHLQPVPLMFPSHPPTVLPVAPQTFGAARPVATAACMAQALPPPPPYAAATTPPPHPVIKSSASDEGGLSSDGGAAMVPPKPRSAQCSVPFGDSVTSMPALAQTKTAVSSDQSQVPPPTPPTTTVVVPPPHPAMCRHFKRGRCNRHNCRFVHDDVWFQANLAAKRERKVQQMVLEAESQLANNRQRAPEEGEEGKMEEKEERNHKELAAVATANAEAEAQRDAFCSGDDDCDDSLAFPLDKAGTFSNDKKKPSLPTSNNYNGGPIAFLRDATDPFARTASLNAAVMAGPKKKTCLSDQKLTHPPLNAALLLLNGGTAVSNAPGVAPSGLVGTEGAAMVVEDLTNSGKSAKTHASDATYKSHSMSAATLLAIDPAPIRFESDLKQHAEEEEQTSAVEESSSGEYELTEG